MTSIPPLSLLQPFLLTLVHITLKVYQQDVCKPQSEKLQLALEVIAWPKSKCNPLLPLSKYCLQQRQHVGTLEGIARTHLIHYRVQLSQYLDTLPVWQSRGALMTQACKP